MEEDSPHFSGDAFLPFFAINDGLSRSIPRNTKWRSERKNEDRFKRKDWKNTPKAKRNEDSVKTPWKKTAIYSPGVIGLHEEINDFFEVMKPTEQEQEIRLKVVEHITRTVHSLWPQAQVEVFGSFRTGLYLPSSDIDIVVLGEWKSLPLSTLSKALEANGVLNSDITVIPSANVPIIRLVHSPSTIRVDISFNLINGVKGAKLIKKLTKEHPALPKLVFVLKQYLVHRGMNEVYNGGMSSYCLTLLIVSFLQGYHKPKCMPSSNLGTLLIEFFEMYGVNFNYEKVSIHFQEGGKYKPRFKTGNFLSVEDPLVEGHDVAKGTYLMRMLKMSFQNAFLVLSRAVNDSAATQTPTKSFLYLILQVDDDALRIRQVIQQDHRKLLRKLSILIDNLGGSPTTQTPAIASTSKRNTKKKKFR